MSSTIRRLALAGCVVLIGAIGLRAQDWPQWRGANRDAKATGFTAPKTWPKELAQKWKVTVGDGVASPALVGDKLYVFTLDGGNEVTRCLDPASGKELWQDKYATQGASGAAGRFAGSRSTPTVAGGKVVTLGVRGILSCLDAASGKVVWRKEEYKGSVPMFCTSSSPIVVDGLCIAQLGGQSNGAIVAYDLESGAEKWKWTGDGAAYASPELLTVEGLKAIVAETDKRIVAVGLADGKLLWEAAFNPGRGSGRYNSVTPVIDGQTVIYGGPRRGTTAVKFEKQGDKLAAKELWTNADATLQYNTPALKNGLLFAMSDRDTLYCVNAETGKTAWTAAAPLAGNRGYGSVVDAGAALFALTPAGELVVYEPSDKEFKEIAKYKLSEGGTYAYPIIAGNRVFVKDKDSVAMWTIE